MGLDRRIGEMYQGTHSMEVVHALRHLLEPGDIFIDVGANIGYLSAVAADRVGPSGRVVAFEPVPIYAACVRRLASENPQLQIDVVMKAVGEEEGRADIDVSSIGNIGWNTMVRGLMPDSHRAESIQVDVIRLDRTLDALGVKTPTLIKIDVEGYELSVLKSMIGLWERGERPLIICEVNPYAFELAAASADQIGRLVGRHGYRSLDLLDLRREVDLQDPLLPHRDILFAPSPMRLGTLTL
jgi:FkbM family methyltransferase